MESPFNDSEYIKLQVSVADQQVLIYALIRLLYDLVYTKTGELHNPSHEELEKVREIVDKQLPDIRDTLVCKCGHVIADHDERGCTYIGCKNVCLKNDG
jgi:hypothetical protein